MKSLWTLFCFLLGACAQTPPADLAIRGVTIVDVTDGSLRPDHAVLIKGNRIMAVGPTDEVRMPGGAEVIEAGGGYLIPGLWDMHTHSVADADWHFRLFLAYGVTGIRNMNDETGDVTLELTNRVRRRLVEGDYPGPPRFFANGPSIDGAPPLASNPVVVRTASEARAAVDSLADAGAEFVKVYENLSREAYFAIVEQAGRRGLPVDGHVPFRLTPGEVADAGQRTVEHPEALAAGCSTGADAERERFARVLAGYESLPEGEKFLALFRHVRALYDSRDPAACAPTIEAYHRNGVAVTADLVAYYNVVNANQVLSDTESMRLVPQAIRRNWEDWSNSETSRQFREILRPILTLELENVRLLHEAGIVLLAATDVGVSLQVPGIGLHAELARLVEAGLTPLDALRTATLNPALVLGLAESLGTIETGKLADLVLLAANPLADIRNTQGIRAVVADGRLYRRADIDRLLAEVEGFDQPVEEHE